MGPSARDTRTALQASSAPTREPRVCGLRGACKKEAAAGMCPGKSRELGAARSVARDAAPTFPGVPLHPSPFGARQGRRAGGGAPLHSAASSRGPAPRPGNGGGSARSPGPDGGAARSRDIFSGFQKEHFLSCLIFSSFKCKWWGCAPRLA